MTDEILALCKAMGAGDGEALLLPLIQAVVPALEGRLRAGTAAADCGPAFPLAAAMMAMDALEGASGESRVASFTAGDVSIRAQTVQTGGDSRAAQAERLLAPWLGETGFAFRGVAG